MRIKPESNSSEMSTAKRSQTLQPGTLILKHSRLLLKVKEMVKHLVQKMQLSSLPTLPELLSSKDSSLVLMPNLLPLIPLRQQKKSPELKPKPRELLIKKSKTLDLPLNREIEKSRTERRTENNLKTKLPMLPF